MLQAFIYLYIAVAERGKKRVWLSNQNPTIKQSFGLKATLNSKIQTQNLFASLVQGRSPLEVSANTVNERGLRAASA